MSRPALDAQQLDLEPGVHLADRRRPCDDMPSIGSDVADEPIPQQITLEEVLDEIERDGAAAS